jgi:hypothetical protein
LLERERNHSMGEIFQDIIMILVITFFTILLILGIQHWVIQKEVNSINYNTCEIISTKGYFSRTIYNDLEKEISRYGDFNIKLKLTKSLGQDLTDTFFSENDIIDKYLKIGDEVTIQLENRKETSFEKLLNISLLGYLSKGHVNIKVKSIKSAPISKNGSEIVSGYDVIADITNNTDNTIAILVSTKLNQTGKYYGSSTHQDITTTNISYGDTADERDGGNNYILNQGSFYIEKLFYGNGNVRLVHYIQQ